MTIRVTWLILLACLFAIPGAPQQPTPDREGFDPSYRLAAVRYSGEFRPLLSHLADSYAVTIGFEADPRRPRPTVNVAAEWVDLPGLLDAVIRAVPGYQWRGSGGAIDVLPSSGGAAFLEARLGALRVSDAGQGEAIERLMSTPEARDAFRAAGLRFDGSEGEGARRVSLNLEGVTMREALHEIVRLSGSKFWSVSVGEGGEVRIATRKATGAAAVMQRPRDS